MSPLILGQISGTLSRLPPFFNVTVSNVVISNTPLYLCGAEMEAMYPTSILFDGYALNITLVGYHDRVAVGFTGCRDAVPSLQRLAVYTGEELGRLEQALGLGAGAAKPKPKPKPASKRPGKPKAKTAKRAGAGSPRKRASPGRKSAGQRKATRH